MPSGTFIRLKKLGFLYVDIAISINARINYSSWGYTSITTYTEKSYLLKLTESALLFELRRNRDVFLSGLWQHKFWPEVSLEMSQLEWFNESIRSPHLLYDKLSRHEAVAVKITIDSWIEVKDYTSLLVISCAK